MKKICAVLTSIYIAASGFGIEITLPEKPSPVMQTAASELKYFIGVTQAADIPSFKLQVDRKLAPEEWLIKQNPGKVILISGGSDRGVLYGVYEFLEKCAGIRFYSAADTFIPKLEKLAVPADLELSGKPRFKYRMLGFEIKSDDHDKWYGRNRIQSPSGKVKYGAYYFHGSPNRCHTYAFYTRNSGLSKECFALRHGKRLIAEDGNGPGQPCLSNPQTLELFKKKLREYIAGDRKKAAAEGRKYPVVYNVSQNDNGDYCECGDCRAGWKKFGGPGGLQLDFINKLAADIEKDYPDILISTSAYMFSEDPEAVAPRKNVMLELAQLGPEFSGKRNTLLSIRHPLNAESLACFRAWAKFGTPISIWDYGMIYNDDFPSPYTEVRGYAETLSEYSKANVQSVYLEAEIYWIWKGDMNTKVASVQSFCDLKNYTFARLTLDGETDIEKLISEFMHNYYGPAAKPMKQYLDYLEKRQNAAKGMNVADVVNRDYLDPEFFETVEKLLSEAENAVKDEPQYWKRVRQERFLVDYAVLGMWKVLFAENKPQLKPEAVEKRLAETEKMVIEKYFPEKLRPGMLKLGALRRAALLDAIVNPPPPPPDFLKGKALAADFYAANFDNSKVAEIVDDPEAFTGKAFKLGDITIGGFDNIHSYPFELGIYDMGKRRILAQKKFTENEIPQDEKYHWFGFKDTVLAPRCRMWGNMTWELTPVKSLHKAYDWRTPARKFDVWISYKLTGPAYVKGSRKDNAEYVDRVIVVKK